MTEQEIESAVNIVYEECFHALDFAHDGEALPSGYKVQVFRGVVNKINKFCDYVEKNT